MPRLMKITMMKITNKIAFFFLFVSGCFMSEKLDIESFLSEILERDAITLVDLARISGVDDNGFLLEEKNKYFSFYRAESTGLGPGYAIEARGRNSEFSLHIISIILPIENKYSEAHQLIGRRDIKDLKMLGGAGIKSETYMVNGKAVSFNWNQLDNKLIKVVIVFPEE